MLSGGILFLTGYPYLPTQGKDAEAIFSWQGPHVAGRVHDGGETWTLEGCGHHCYLWIKQADPLRYGLSSVIVTPYTTQAHSLHYARLRVTMQ